MRFSSRRSALAARRHRGSAVVAAAVAAMAAAQVRSATYTWTAGDNSFGYLDLADNWKNGQPPMDYSATLVFGPNRLHAYAPTDRTAYPVLGVQFSSGAPAYTLAGTSNAILNLAEGGIQDLATIPQTITEEVSANADQTWTVSAIGGLLNMAYQADPVGHTLNLTVVAGSSLNTSSYLGTGPNGGLLTMASAGTINAAAVKVEGLPSQGGTAGTISQTSGTVNTGGSLVVATDAGFSGTFNLSGGTLNAAQLRVGDGGTGRFTQAGGTAATHYVYVGNANGSVGTYAMRGGSLAVTATGGVVGVIAVGYNAGASGTFDQSAGAVSADYTSLAPSAGGTGAVNLSGGTFTSTTTVVGSGGSGTVAQTGGTFNGSAGTLYLGYAAGASGQYTLSAPGSTAPTVTAANLLIGYGGTGTVNQSGGAVTATGLLSVADQQGSTGSYTLSGGTVTAAAAYVGTRGAGSLAQTGGTFNLGTGTLYLGDTSTGAGSYTLSAGGTLVAGSVSTTGGGTGTLNLNGGTLRATTNTAGFLSVSHAVVLAGGAVIDTQAYTVSIAVPLVGSITSPGGGLTKLGTGTLTLAGAANLGGGVNVSGGSLVFAAANQPALSYLRLSAGTSAVVTATAATPHLLSISSLSVPLSPTGVPLATIDVTGGGLDLPPASLAAVTALATAGFAGGTWAGPGVTSSLAAADPAHLTAVGVIRNLDAAQNPIYTTFDGEPVGYGDALARYTYYGDTNLDGVVNAADYTRIDAGFVMHLTGWQNGDLNYDGVVDGSDYTLVDNAFNRQGGAVAAPAAATAVPEPRGGAAASVLSVLAVAGRGRRAGRRRSANRIGPAAR